MGGEVATLSNLKAHLEPHDWVTLSSHEEMIGVTRHNPIATFDIVAEDLAATSEAIRGQMFGMPCLKINGKVFAGFYQEAMVFKLRGEAHAQALALPGALLFDPSGRGRPMKAWVIIPAEYAARWGEFAQYAYASAVSTF